MSAAASRARKAPVSGAGAGVTSTRVPYDELVRKYRDALQENHRLKTQLREANGRNESLVRLVESLSKRWEAKCAKVTARNTHAERELARVREIYMDHAAQTHSCKRTTSSKSQSSQQRQQQQQQQHLLGAPGPPPPRQAWLPPSTGNGQTPTPTSQPPAPPPKMTMGERLRLKREEEEKERQAKDRDAQQAKASTSGDAPQQQQQQQQKPMTMAEKLRAARQKDEEKEMERKRAQEAATQPPASAAAAAPAAAPAAVDGESGDGKPAVLPPPRLTEKERRILEDDSDSELDSDEDDNDNDERGPPATQSAPAPVMAKASSAPVLSKAASGHPSRPRTPPAVMPKLQMNTAALQSIWLSGEKQAAEYPMD
ncbi:unnamed protein product [Vitrella brassicaformis CCMP3155]|uniref:Uncharacterized protein n=2 Tax=Vitrella brassicaformis TaxID=1169539 RepID=A0A0G4G5H7_VITBC|nr:unnamed protein product [Vitrella brassicaformis CCMP3155]|eukprot:CEM23490.1 unnamed protein product [Vitrella brassicaformis CCMP3155]